MPATTTSVQEQVRTPNLKIKIGAHVGAAKGTWGFTIVAFFFFLIISSTEKREC